MGLLHIDGRVGRDVTRFRKHAYVWKHCAKSAHSKLDLARAGYEMPSFGFELRRGLPSATCHASVGWLPTCQDSKPGRVAAVDRVERAKGPAPVKSAQSC